MICIMEVSPNNMEKGDSIKLPEEKVMICTNNCEDNAFYDDGNKGQEEKMMTVCANNSKDDCNIKVSKGINEDVEVDIIDNLDQDEGRVAEMEPHDVTESESASSSSFGFTEDFESESDAGCSDVEVESQVRDDKTLLPRMDGFNDVFGTKKKKLRADWRQFIRPLMWRCKWVELQIRELHSQACEYDRQLLECRQRKLSCLDKSVTEELGVKSAPLFNRSVKLMKRKKRKRVEETVDLTSYTSSHSLFSYYASKRPCTDSMYMDDDHGSTEKMPFGNDEFGGNADWVSFEFDDSNAFETNLRKIEEVQLHVRQLRARVDKIVREHTGKLVSDDPIFVLGDQSVCCGPNSDLPHVKTEEVASGSGCTTSQQTCEKKLAMVENSVVSCGDVIPLPDTVESIEQPQSVEKIEKMEHEILIHNQPVKEELDNISEVGKQLIAQSLLATRGKARNIQRVSNPNSASNMPVKREQSTLKMRSISKLITPKNKRKRGRRKARSGRWSRRSTG